MQSQQKQPSLTYSPLPQYQIVRFSGPDAASFLQGQLSADVVKLSEQGSFAAHCNVKGRMISSFYIKRINNDYLIRVHREISDIAIAALKKYMLFSKVTLSVETELNCIAFKGEQLQERLERELELTSECWHMLNEECAELWIDKSAEQQLVNKLQAQTEDTEFWPLVLLQEGLAELREGQSEEFLPQELNYDLIGAVNFKKGCYTGQEVIARLHYRGQLKKHLRLASCAPSKLQNKAALIDKDRKKVGASVQSYTTKERTWLLCLCNDSSYESNDISIESCDKGLQKVQWHQLPYAIP
ncbi:folate-binding protein YgfZ [Agaribacterium sp. ZY112]|uniref:CAF17-like 4Fe-4S cluster assembly/insertion protein YgfZ n=1 Tax=Agaribacterium sp. ZY112 TaxID=3233574 RepID=UPI0035260C72